MMKIYNKYYNKICSNFRGKLLGITGVRPSQYKSCKLLYIKSCCAKQSFLAVVLRSEKDLAVQVYFSL
jgi:hypothetical protein